MSQFIEAEIVIPALKAAIEQISQISLSKLGFDITELPFWLAVIGFPLAVFETCTKHIATALNVLLHKAHDNLREFTSLLIILFALAGVFTLFLFGGYQKGLISHSVTQVELTKLFYYVLLFLGGIMSCLFIVSLSKLTGQGNYVTGIGFLMGAASIYIEVVQEYGLVGQVSCFAAFITTIGLWIYGRNYNLTLEKQRKTDEPPIYQTVKDRSIRLKRIRHHRIEK